MHNEQESIQKSFEPEGPHPSPASNFLILLIAGMVISCIAMIAYAASGLPGIVIGVLILAYCLLEGVAIWLFEVIATAVGKVVSRTVIMLRRIGVIPAGFQLSEIAKARLKSALLVSLLIAMAWLTHRLIVDR